MFRMPPRRSPRSNRRLKSAAAALRELLPPGWTILITENTEREGRVRVGSPAGATAELLVWARSELSPRSAAALEPTSGPAIAFARWLSARTQEVLRERGIDFLDSTGNAEITLDSPAVVIRTDGAGRDPKPKQRSGPSLRGSRAIALMRTLAEVSPPYGVRELADALDVDPGYVSRVLAVLVDETLVERQPRGPVTGVDWQAMLRHVARSYELLRSNVVTTYVAPRGIEDFFTDLATGRPGRWAVTGSFASVRLAPVAAPALAMVYAEDPERVAKTGRLFPADRGANVIVLEPSDPIVFERTWIADDVPFVSVAQVAIDDMTGNGRMPSEGEALLEWMARRLDHWRAPSLADTVNPTRMSA